MGLWAFISMVMRLLNFKRRRFGLMRLAVAGAAFAAMAFSVEAAGAETLKFKVLQNGKQLGTHTVSLSRKGEFTFVKSHLNLEYKVGPLTIFHYRSHCAESWKVNRLDRMSCSIDKTGKKERIDVTRDGDKLIIQQGGKRVRKERGAVPISPWNSVAMKSSKAIVADNGSVAPLQALELGFEKIELGGRRVDAHKVRYKSFLVVDSWSDSRGRWLKATFKTLGKNIEIRRV
jgi:hypothetical protein